MDQSERIVMSKLLNEIGDRSLQNILRRNILGGENLTDVIAEERPCLEYRLS